MVVERLGDSNLAQGFSKVGERVGKEEHERPF